MDPKFLCPHYSRIIQSPEVMEIGQSYAEQSSEENTNIFTLPLTLIWWKIDPLP